MNILAFIVLFGFFGAFSVAFAGGRQTSIFYKTIAVITCIASIWLAIGVLS